MDHAKNWEKCLPGRHPNKNKGREMGLRWTDLRIRRKPVSQRCHVWIRRGTKYKASGKKITNKQIKYEVSEMGSLKTMVKMLDFILNRIRIIGGLNAEK